MAQIPADKAAVEQMWQAFRQATGSGAALTGAFAFGDTPAMADEPLPQPGDHCVVLGGGGEPVCVIRTTDVRVSPFDLVDAAFAWDEGEGDRSLSYWQQAHREFFQRQCERAGVPFGDDLPVVLERFDLVWPRG
jgi:uncharacterized protein YhfF